MSLKDRLNTNVNQLIPEEIKQPEPQYYVSDEDANNNINTLGAIDVLLADEEINNIYINGAKNVYIEKRNKIYKSTSAYRDEVQLENIVSKFVPKIKDKNYFKFNYKDGINIETILPPISNKVVLNIKIYRDKYATIKNLLEKMSISKEIALVLESFSEIDKNILIVGERNTLKTSLLSAISKKLSINNRGAIIDFEGEFKREENNFSNFDFSQINNESEITDILKSIIRTSPEKIFINDLSESIISLLSDLTNENSRNILATLTANTPKEAMDKIARILVNANNGMSYEMAKLIAYKMFDIVVFVKKDDEGNRILSSISELDVDVNKECNIHDIFAFDSPDKIRSTGYIPAFLDSINENSFSINANIFDENYRHTYYQNVENDSNIQRRNLNIDILKKFKKDLPAKEDILEKMNEKENISSYANESEQESNENNYENENADL